MPLEDLTGPDKYLNALNRLWPENDDQKLEGDDHISGIKNVVLNTFPSLDGPVDFTAADMSQGIKNGLEATIPIGGVTLYAGTSGTVPANFLLCQGQAVDRTTYADLFAAIGTTWGAGDGSTTFNLPDMRGRAAEGVTVAEPLGNERGAETHTLTAAQSGVGAHRHYVARNETKSGRGGPSSTRAIAYHMNSNSDDEYWLTQASNGLNANVYQSSSTSAGASESHNIVAPRAAMYYVIRAL